MKLVVGLGNPGERYEHSRHNIGFSTVETLAKDLGAHFRHQREFESLVAEGRLLGEPYLLVKPLTYMNQSGRAVSKIVRYFELSLDETLVILDDIFLKIGLLRFRQKGSSGGQKGLQSILDSCESPGIPRLRMGVGLPQDQGRGWVEHVLSSFPRDQLEQVRSMIHEGAAFSQVFISKDSEEARKWLSDHQSRKHHRSRSSSE